MKTQTFNRIRTRYAPSPTGYLHLGGARTALFCYLFAKHYNGDFLIRIEDTDIERHVEDGEKSQIENLEWMGVIADESPVKSNLKYAPYRQSERLDIYDKYLKVLLDKGHAYECFDTTEEIESQKRYQQSKGFHSFRYDRNWLKISNSEKDKRRNEKQVSYRLALPKNKVLSWTDIVRGKIEVNTNEISEFVIAKSNGIPTYNFANVVDDHLMEISHVFRGEEHISNTPKQLIMYEMFEWKKPEFGHFTIITNNEHKKLSKRDTSLKQFVEQFKDEKYVPEALFNFLALLGWSPEKVGEILSKEELIKSFDVNRLSKSPSMFDQSKLEWMSNHYFKKLNLNELKKYTLPFLGEKLQLKSEEWIETLLLTYQKQMFSGAQIDQLTQMYFEENDNFLNVTPEIQEYTKRNIDVVKTFASELVKINFEMDQIKQAIANTQKITNKKGKDLFMPIRIATTFHEHGPELDRCIYLFGEKKIKERLNRWLT